MPRLEIERSNNPPGRRAAFGQATGLTVGQAAQHTRCVSVAEKSRHLLGCAADIAPIFKHRTSGEMEKFKALAGRMFTLPAWEVKVYPTFVHVAVPREEEGQGWNGETMIL